MGLLSGIGSFVSSFKLNDVVGGLFGDSLNSLLGSTAGQFATDVLSGAATNAAVSAIAGGDVGKAALYGAVGGGLSGTGLGGWSDEIGGAVSGYGLADSMGENGLIGAAAGGIGAYLSGASSSSSSATAPTSKPASKNVAQNGGQSGVTPAGQSSSSSSVASTTSGVSISDKLKDMGLMTSDGDGSLLGKALLSGIGSVAEYKSTQDLAEDYFEKRKELERYQKELDHEEEQKRIAAFTNPNNQFMVVRNG